MLQIIYALLSCELTRLWTITALLTVANNNHIVVIVERMFWNKVNCSFILCNYYWLRLMFVCEHREKFILTFLMKFRFQRLWILLIKECMFQIARSTSFAVGKKISQRTMDIVFVKNFSTMWSMFQQNRCLFVYEKFTSNGIFICKRDASVKHTLGCLWYVLQKIRSH